MKRRLLTLATLLSIVFVGGACGEGTIGGIDDSGVPRDSFNAGDGGVDSLDPTNGDSFNAGDGGADSLDPTNGEPPTLGEPGEPPLGGQPTAQFRSIDGTGNNMEHFELGAADTTLRRMTREDYGDSVASMAGAGRPSPREISNALCADTFPGPNALGASDFLWQWGQFVDHDIGLTEAQAPAEPMPIAVACRRSFFRPGEHGNRDDRFQQVRLSPGHRQRSGRSAPADEPNHAFHRCIQRLRLRRCSSCGTANQ